MVAKDRREVDTDVEVKMHLKVCPRPCVLSQTGGWKEEGQRMEERYEKQIQTIRLEIDGLEIAGCVKYNR